MDECLICKKHYTQEGKCPGGRKNCLMFIEEPKGKKIRGTFRIEMNSNAETSIIKPFAKISLTDTKGKDFVADVIKINWVNMSSMILSIDADYYEAEMPTCEKKKKMFRVLK